MSALFYNTVIIIEIIVFLSASIEAGQNRNSSKLRI